MRTPAATKIFLVIQNHIGRDQAISAREICRELGWSEGLAREVRRIISEEGCLFDGVLVCAYSGKNSGGYFCAATYEEALTYRNWIANLSRKASKKLELIDRACARFGFNFKRASQT